MSMTAPELRTTDVDIFGDMLAWGSHFCLFYETKEDLLDALVSYCKSGLERGEYCLWIVAEPLTIEDAKEALRDAMPDLDRHFAALSIELVRARDWYLKDGAFDNDHVARGLDERLARVAANGHAGVRVTGDMSWLVEDSRPHCQFKLWKDFCEHEDGINGFIANKRVAGLCTYPLAACGAAEIMDVVRTHQFAIARRHGAWELVETASLKQAKAEIKRINEELEQRVMERTSELLLVFEDLHEAQVELKRANRVTMMGQMAASIVHEVNQPIAAAMTNAYAALRWLDTNPPDFGEVRQALDQIIKAGNRASDVIGRIQDLVKKAPLHRDGVELNDMIHDVIALIHGEVVKSGVCVRTQLMEGLPLIQGDRIQLQQVMLNLIINAVEAIKGMSDGPRELIICTARDTSSSAVLVTVQDTGPGMKPESLNRLFDPFYTTKPGGMGMGLSICRSIVEAHGGRVWATSSQGVGATVQFTLPVSEGLVDRI
ncbi:signal transduction histidine kinase [Nitrobacteraceae bacterium AZCC 1564]